MDEPIPPTADNVFERTTAEIEALKSYQPKTDAERRRCATELVRLKQAQIDLAKQVISENAAQQIAEVIGHDYVKPGSASRLNGNSHVPIDRPNWAQVIAESELRCERQIATLKEDVTDHAAKSGGLGNGEITALAQGLVPFLNERLAEAVAPLQERIAELEATATRYEGIWDEQRVYRLNMMVTYGGNLWIAEEVSSNVRPGQSDVWRLMHKTKGRK
jgi:hypothetical protein